MPNVHSERHLRLLAIAAERSLADEQADEQALIKLRQLCHRSVSP
jgi:hypothetical protein